jgi:anti-sigma-K factor RskA
MTNDSPSIRAGEYVLGTLSGAERDAFEIDLAGDTQLQVAVQAWERRLAPLAGMNVLERPSSTVWAEIERKLDAETRTMTQASPANSATIVQLRRSVRVWRGFTAASAALAAALALFIVVGERMQVAEPGQDYVAVVNRGGDLPALIVHVDTREGVVRVRSLAAQTPSNKSLELWYVAAGQAPKSLGLVENSKGPFVLPASLRQTDVEGSSIAVSVEQKGGSTTGAPSNQIVYQGKLIKDVQ